MRKIDISQREQFEGEIEDFFKKRAVEASDYFHVSYGSKRFHVVFARSRKYGCHSTISDYVNKRDAIKYSVLRFEHIICAVSGVAIAEKTLMIELLKRGLPQELAKSINRASKNFNLTGLDEKAVKLKIHQCIVEAVTLAFDYTALDVRKSHNFSDMSPIDRYTNRDHEDHPTAEDFLKDKWNDWLKSGRLTQAQVRKADPQLMAALDNQFRGRRDILAKLVPPKSVESDKRLQDALGYVPQGERRRHALSNLAKGFTPRKPNK